MNCIYAVKYYAAVKNNTTAIEQFPGYIDV